MSTAIYKLSYTAFISVFRNKVVFITGVVIIVLLVVAAWGGYRNYQKVEENRTTAKAEKRQQWLAQDPKHPHIAAHFGTFAYKPKTILSLIDLGLDNYSGSYAYLEPHHQNDFIFKPSEEYNGAIRFGQLSVAMVLQLIIPLLVIFMGFSSITLEREYGTLKLLYSNGVSLRKLAAGKILGLYTALLLVLMPALGITILYFITQAHPLTENDLAERVVLMLTAYCLYLLFFTCLTVLVSALCNKSKNALLVLLALWVVFCIIIPKTAANIGDNMYPLPSQYAFKEAINTDISNGIDGHNSRDKRAKAIEQALLTQYHVDSISKLPFNFEGFVMQAGEEYSSHVYDKYFHRIQQTYANQNEFGRYASIVNPYMAVQNISMGLASTDIFSHIDFQLQAEAYRRSFVQKMNEDMKNHSSLGDWNYKAGKALYASVPDFTYAQIPASKVLARYKVEITSIFASLLLLIGLLFYILNKKSIRQPL